MNKKNKKLKIAQIAPLWFTIPPKKYGGIERIVAELCDGLVDKGHDVTLFAAPGSKTKAKLISVFPKPLIEGGVSWSDPFWNLRNLAKAYEMADKGEFDIIHSHMDVWTLFFQNLTKVPTISTMHNSLLKTGVEINKDFRMRLYNEERKNSNIAFISRSAKDQSAIKFKSSLVIYNGINLKHFKFNPVGGDHFIWVSRIDDYKGIENAIAAAEKLKVKLFFAGRLDKSQVGYFNKKIKPHLNKNIVYFGELTESQLSDFYGNAKAFIYPIEWEEPFGLVVAESMACGTPVIAYDRGSMSELIKDGKTGFVVDSNLNALIRAMKKIDKIDRREVRKRVEKMFSKRTMVENYEKFYYKLISRKSHK
ncbi:MAG: glycosyltransferase family 4 protein [Patescibacteria group bacterium]|nr:glycosyltransferase family 4 protein [Patescibacteria group bacterium]